MLNEVLGSLSPQTVGLEACLNLSYHLDATLKPMPKKRRAGPRPTAGGTKATGGDVTRSKSPSSPGQRRAAEVRGRQPRTRVAVIGVAEP